MLPAWDNYIVTRFARIKWLPPRRDHPRRYRKAVPLGILWVPTSPVNVCSSWHTYFADEGLLFSWGPICFWQYPCPPVPLFAFLLALFFRLSACARIVCTLVLPGPVRSCRHNTYANTNTNKTHAVVTLTQCPSWHGASKSCKQVYVCFFGTSLDSFEDLRHLPCCL